MGMVLSRLCNSGEISWYYLVSLLQVEYRRWILVRLLRRGMNGKASSADGNSRPAPSTATVSTQTRLSVAETCIDFTMDDTAATPFPSSSASPETGVFEDISLSSDSESYVADDDDDDGDEQQRDISGSVASSEYNDICIFESPDFTKFGHNYQHLASPRDNHLRCVTPRARCVSSLSPVKEELDTEQCGDDIPGNSTYDTFLTFEDEEDSGAGGFAFSDSGAKHGHANPGRQRLGGVSETPVRDRCSKDHPRRATGNREAECCATWMRCQEEGSCRSNVPYCSFSSSDSGFGEGLNKSASSTVFTDGSSLPSSASDLPHHCYTHHEVFSETCPSFPNSDRLCKAKHTRNRVLHENGEGHARNEDRICQTLFQPQANNRFKARRRVTFLEDTATSSSSSSSSSPYASSSSSKSTSQSSYPSAANPPSPSSSFSKGWQTPPRHPWSSESPVPQSSDDSHSSSIMYLPSSPEADDVQHFFAEPAEGRDLLLITESSPSSSSFEAAETAKLRAKFHVHSSLLLGHCHALRLHVRGTGSREVLLVNARAEHVLCFLRQLYYPLGEEITENTLEGTLDVAQHLGCQTVTRRCERFLVNLSHLQQLCPHRLSLGRSPSQTYYADRGDGIGGFGNGGSNSTGESEDRGYRSDCCNHFDDPENPPSPTFRHQLWSSAEDTPSTAAAIADHVPSTLCACADRVAERVVDILQMALKYELHDAYGACVDVAARMTIGEWRKGARYSHLSSKAREDILQSRVARLENVIKKVTLTRSSLIGGCSQDRHDPDDHVPFNGGVVCLRCTSQRIMEEAQLEE